MVASTGCSKGPSFSNAFNRTRRYRNKFVHRRDSVSLAGMNEKEIEARMKVGLVTAADEEYSDEDEDVR